jgi:hypothetical protein
VERPAKFNADTVELRRVRDVKPAAPPVKGELVGLWVSRSAEGDATEVLFHFRRDGTIRYGARDEKKRMHSLDGRYTFDAAASPMRLEWAEDDVPASVGRIVYGVRFIDADTLELRYSADRSSARAFRRVPLKEWPETRPEFSAACQQVRAQAEAGDARAQGVLAGWWLDNEQGTGADYAQALQWAKRSAEQQHPFGRYVLARLLRDGLAVAADPARAKQLFEQCRPQMTKLAEAGDATAACRLGVMFGEGNGVAKDPEKSREWFTRAAAHNHAPSQCILGGLAREAGKFDEAAAWWRKAAEKGNARAQLSLAVLLSQGKGVAKDDAAAVTWARQAAERNEPIAAVFLGKFSGSDGLVDSREAAKWLAKAEKLLLPLATQGEPHAAFQLGQLYDYDLGAHRPDDAKKWYKLAADRGFPPAQAAYDRLTKGTPSP